MCYSVANWRSAGYLHEVGSDKGDRVWRLERQPDGGASYLISGTAADWRGYLFVAPSLVFLVVFVILPIIAAFYYSLTDYDLMQAPRFAGLKNYANLGDDIRFRH